MYSFVWLELSNAKASEYDKCINCEVFHFAKHQLTNILIANSVLPYLGGMLIINRVISPRVTASKVLAISSKCLDTEKFLL